MTKKTIIKSFPLRIVHVVQHFSPFIGGIERHVAIVAAEQARLGNEVKVLTPFRDHTAIRSEQRNGFGVIRYASSPRRHLQGSLEALSLLNWLRRLDFDVLHCHGLSCAETACILLRKEPRVLTIHSESHIPNTRNWRGRIAARALTKCGHVIIVAEHLKAHLSSLRIDSLGICVVNNPVPTQTLRPPTQLEKLELRRQWTLDQGPVVLYLGRLSKEKGINVLTEAWKRISRAMGNASLLVVGDGPERSALEKLKIELGNVRLIGWQEDVAPFLRLADVMVLPSNREGFPCSITEAAACGLPVVATSTRGSIEAITAANMGILVPLQNSAAISNEVQQLLRDPIRRLKFSEQGREYAERNWSVTETVKRITWLYENLLSAEN